MYNIYVYEYIEMASSMSLSWPFCIMLRQRSVKAFMGSSLGIKHRLRDTKPVLRYPKHRLGDPKPRR